ncbi:MAG: nucleotide exchange factor GrpE [Clostridia bacterium]|nr:nucleotide exchange factor GrpE [Clostridia bacterium]
MSKDKKHLNKEKTKNEDTAVEIETETEAANESAETESDGSVVFTKDEFDRAKAEIERMQKECEEAKKATDEAILDAQRIQAEFANFRKRNATVRADSMDDGVRDTIKALLPVLDNFDRAFDNSDGSPFAKGMEQIHKQLIACLEKCGLETVESEGAFDPNLHEAVMQDDESDAESGTITAVLQKGYRVKGKIIRHTMVKVKS